MTSISLLALAGGVFLTAAPEVAHAQPDTVQSHQKISDTEGSFNGVLDNSDWFGFSLASLGDLDGDGISDLAAGAPSDDDGGFNHGAVWVLFLNSDGTVKSKQKISDTQGGFGGMLNNSSEFGRSVASLGDLDGDGIGDLAVGVRDHDGGSNRGAVWVLFLEQNGTVKSEQKISDTQGGFEGALINGDSFGSSIAGLGDLDGDGVGDLAVGAASDNDGGSNRGAVWVLFLNTDGTVKSEQKISDMQGGFGGVLDDDEGFGNSVASLADLDGDGFGDLAVGAVNDDDGGTSRGAVWILFLKQDGTVKSEQKISDTEGGFEGLLDDFDAFGWSVASLGDLDGDGLSDIAVGAQSDDDGASDSGAAWVLFLNENGTVKSHQKISNTQGGFEGILDPGDLFGGSLASLGDLNGDGIEDLSVGAWLDDDGGLNRGAVWVLFLDGFLADCNGNGVEDEEDIADGTSLDCNGNGVPDECSLFEIDCNENAVPDQCDIDEGTSDDCNDNAVPDECEPDCNGNAVPDECDISGGASQDCDLNGVPDDCESDCNNNGTLDLCDISDGTSDDCNDNAVPDECEPDCNGNGVADECDISDGSSGDCDLDGVPNECEPDCNNNGTSDSCDILDGTSEDCTGNNVPDECEPDCNDNGQADSCDIGSGVSEDINLSGVPDECEPQVTIYVDDDAAGQPVQDGTAENPYATIGQALEAAPTDQALVEIVVADGLYVGDGNKNLDFGGKILTLRSVNGPLSTIIDCEGAGRGFFFINGETRDAILDGFTIRNGRAENGGAIQCRHRSKPTIRNCILTANVAEGTGRGGGLFAGIGSPLITHCVIVGNIAEGTGRGGGGIFIVGIGSDLQPSIENSLIAGNTAFQGGGIWAQSNLDIRNCTIARNTAATQGGGIFAQASALVTVSNCVLWGDTAEMGSEIYLRHDDTGLSVTYSDVQGGQAGVEGPGTLIWESGNIDADPSFVDADQGNYRLLPGSPAVDAGDSTAVPPDTSDLDGDGDTAEPVPFDLDGQPRFLNEPDTPDTGNPDGVHPIVDMGPYEIGLPGCPDQDIEDGQVTICHMPQGNAGTITVNVNALPGHLAHGDTCGPCGSFPSCNPTEPPDAPEGQTVWYVDDDACPESGSGSPADPFCKIQDGIDASDQGDMVLVAPGTYFENISFFGKSITVQSYEPTNAEVVECTIIDGSLGVEVYGVVAFFEGEDEDAILQGFTITHGMEDSSGNGIACAWGSDPTIAHCVISNNSAPEGAGIFIDASSPTISDCTITQNSAFLGGGIKIGPDSNPVIRNCSILDNFSYRGGGINTLGNATLTDCVLSGNTTADGSGGAIYNGGGGALVVTGCVFSNNSTNSSGGGGGIFNDSDSQVTVSNSVFEGNEAIKGGGIFSQYDSQVTVSNCLFQNNVAWWGGGIHALGASSMILTDCTFRQNTATLGSGGGVVSESTDLVATDCIFEGNIAITPPPAGAQQSGALSSDHWPGRPDSTRQAASVTLGYGGGLSVIDAQASVTNCLFVGNMGFRGGAVSCISQSSLDLAHCTMSGNHADATGGGVYISGDVDVVVDNCILRNDTAPEGPEFLIYAGPSTLAVGYSNIQGGQEGIGGGGTVIWGDGNIDIDPLFVDPFGNDYRLLSGSPSIDAGDNTAVPEDVVTDLDGNPRFVDDPGTPDTGNPDGIIPIVDMGPYEFQDPCADNDGDGQVTICHHPNSGNPQTMSVNLNNLPAHLAHGDHCGPCDE